MNTLTSKICQPIIISLIPNQVAAQLICDHAIAVPLIGECFFVEDVKFGLEENNQFSNSFSLTKTNRVACT